MKTAIAFFAALAVVQTLAALAFATAQRPVERVRASCVAPAPPAVFCHSCTSCIWKAV